MSNPSYSEAHRTLSSVLSDMGYDKMMTEAVYAYNANGLSVGERVSKLLSLEAYIARNENEQNQDNIAWYIGDVIDALMARR